MVDVLQSPTLSTEYPGRDYFTLPRGAVYAYAESVERRSHVPRDWSARQAANFIELSEEDYWEFAFLAQQERIRLRSPEELVGFLDTLCTAGSPVYLDVTGLSHHVWAPLVSRMVVRILDGKTAPPFRVVYVEPRDYRKSTVPRPGDIFALSERCHGIRPLPGMLRLRRHYVEANVLVVLLGFEGWRFDAILSAFEPGAGTVVPVVGVPGYRAEYPFYTLEGNYLPLEKDDNWTRREFAMASDPFEAFELLHNLAKGRSGLRIAMVGTKPHSLGAVLFAAVFPSLGELVYDNPIRSEGRTDEGRRVRVYDITGFCEVLRLLGIVEGAASGE